jgi:hypothetical protein
MRATGYKQDLHENRVLTVNYSNPLDPWDGVRQWYRALWPAEQWCVLALITLALVVLVYWVTLEPTLDRLRVKNWVEIARYYDENLEEDPDAVESHKDQHLTKNPKYQDYLRNKGTRILHLRHKRTHKKQTKG